MMARNYAEEYAKYQGTPQQIHNRSLRNQARAKLIKAGVVKKGDGKDVGHIKALGKGGTNRRSNLEPQSVATNRSFARTPTGAMRSEVSKRERRR
jgi:hypothetical protein